MDSILMDSIVIPTFETSTPKENIVEEAYTIWTKQDDKHIPQTHLVIENKLPAGIYKMMFDSYSSSYYANEVNITSDELYDLEDDKINLLIQEIEDFWSKRDLYSKFKLVHKRGLLLEGGPGTGKTSIITILAKKLIQKDGLVFLINNPSDFKYYYESVNPIVRKIEPNRPIITIIEDVDKLIEMTGNDAELLDLLDGKNSIEHHLIILTSNNTMNLSEALLRPSRIDLRVELEPPTYSVRKQFFLNKGLSEEDAIACAEVSEDLSFADLKELFIAKKILNKDIEEVSARLRGTITRKDYLDRTNKIEL